MNDAEMVVLEMMRAAMASPSPLAELVRLSRYAMVGAFTNPEPWRMLKEIILRVRASDDPAGMIEQAAAHLSRRGKA